jgi:hypothetical protein
VPHTVVISDLHLGGAKAMDVLRRPEPLEELCAYLRDGGVRRLVILGDALELRHGPVRDALAVAEPVFAALGDALGEDGTVVLLAGNHDHALVAPWLEKRARRRDPGPLGLDERAGRTASDATSRLAKAAAPAGFDVRYPGIWLRDDVYATHGHYLDRLITVPTFERLAAGAMVRVVGPLPERGATPDDFEAALAPLYAWTHAVAQTPASSWTMARQQASADAWDSLAGPGPRRLHLRALAAMLPLAAAGLNVAGLGPVRPRLTGGELRRAGLRAMNDVVRRLGIDAEHVIFGHTHRAGPLPGDHLHEWRAATGARLHNAGCWMADTVFLRGSGPESPYWPGRALELDEAGPPRLVQVLDPARYGAPHAG